jgi:hypothetical protein
MVTRSRFRTVAPGITLLIVSFGAFAQNSTSQLSTSQKLCIEELFADKNSTSQPSTSQNLPCIKELFADKNSTSQPSTSQDSTNQPFSFEALRAAGRAVQKQNAMCEAFAPLGVDEKVCKSTPGTIALVGGRLIWKQSGTLTFESATDPALQKEALDLQRQYKATMMRFGTQEERAAIWAGDFADFMRSPMARRLGLGLGAAGLAYEFWLLNRPTAPSFATEPNKK